MNFDSGYEMTINGQGVRSAQTIDVINPANEMALARKGSLKATKSGCLEASYPS